MSDEQFKPQALTRFGRSAAFITPSKVTSVVYRDIRKFGGGDGATFPIVVDIGCGGVLVVLGFTAEEEHAATELAAWLQQAIVAHQS